MTEKDRLLFYLIKKENSIIDIQRRNWNFMIEKNPFHFYFAIKFLGGYRRFSIISWCIQFYWNSWTQLRLKNVN